LFDHADDLGVGKPRFSHSVSFVEAIYASETAYSAGILSGAQVTPTARKRMPSGMVPGRRTSRT
ncbi:MAG: hypothetical protein ACR2IV_19115, partial [Bryobacteraceae bacterium]